MRDKTLDKIAKLLALANSANPNEAATARRAADRLMEKHKITPAEARSHVLSGYHELSLGTSDFDQTWKFSLVTATAQFCGCEAIALSMSGRRKIRLAGERADVARAADLFDSLLRAFTELERAEAVFISRFSGIVYSTPDEYVDSYRRGMVAAVVEKMRSLFADRLKRDPPESSPFESSASVAPGSSRDSSKTGWYSKFWSWTLGLSSALPEPVGECRSLVVVTPGKKNHKGKTKERYKPRVVRVDLRDVVDDNAFARGYERVLASIVLPTEHVDSDEGNSKRRA